MIFQALAPTLFGELADSMGRRPVYILLFIIYLGANVGLALQRSYAALLILRMLQSTGSSGVIALANGVVADISHAGERGMYMVSGFVFGCTFITSAELTGALPGTGRYRHHDWARHRAGYRRYS
jgi:MFS family permease